MHQTVVEVVINLSKLPRSSLKSSTSKAIIQRQISCSFFSAFEKQLFTMNYNYREFAFICVIKKIHKKSVQSSYFCVSVNYITLSPQFLVMIKSDNKKESVKIAQIRATFIGLCRIEYESASMEAFQIDKSKIMSQGLFLYILSE